MEVGFDYLALVGCIDAVVAVGCIEAVVAVGCIEAVVAVGCIEAVVAVGCIEAVAVWADYTEVADDMNFLVWVGYCFVVVVVVVHDDFPVFAR